MQRLSFAAGLALGLSGLSALFTGGAFAQSAQQAAAARGLAVYTAKCSACHSVDDSRVGPSHAGVVGRRAGQVKDYAYSEALAQSKIVWTRANLERWLTDPEKTIPGQRMGYRLSLLQERADVIAYLASVSLPKP
jgi:cytochrome c